MEHCGDEVVNTWGLGGLKYEKYELEIWVESFAPLVHRYLSSKMGLLGIVTTIFSQLSYFLLPIPAQMSIFSNP